MSTEQIIQSWEKGIEPYLSETPTPTDHTSRNGQAKLTKEQRENIRFAIRWMDGDKLYRVYHVKGARKGISDAGKQKNSLKPNFANQFLSEFRNERTGKHYGNRSLQPRDAGNIRLHRSATKGG